MGLAFVPLYIKYLGIEAYGLIGLFSLLQAWLSLLDLGMTPTISREMARFTADSPDAKSLETPSHRAQSIRDLLRSIEFVALGIALLIATGVFAASGWLARDWVRANKLSLATVANAFSIMGFVAAVRFVEGIYRSSIIGLQRQVLLNAITSGMSTLRGLGAVGILAWVSPTIGAFFAWQGAISLATVITFALVTYQALPATNRPGRFSMDALRGVWRFAGGMLGISFLSLLLTQSDKLILSNRKMLALSDYGYYVVAAMVAAALWSLATPIVQAWFPRLSQLHAKHDKQGLATSFHQGAQLISVIVGSAAIVMILFSDTLLDLWMQDKLISIRSARLVSLLALGNLLSCQMWIPYQTQLACGWTGLTVRINLVAVLLIVPAICWVTPRYGAEGAAWVWVGLNTGYLFVGVHFMYRRILKSEKWRWYMEDVVMPLGAATLAALLVKWSVPISDSPVLQLVCLASASLLALTCSMLAATHVRNQVFTFGSRLISYLSSPAVREGPPS